MKPIKYNTDFQRRVYEVCATIPKGKTMTYKEIAEKVGAAPIAVGQALKRNPNAPWIPCHRVVHSDGRVGGYSGMRDSQKKINMLKKEGVIIKDGKILKK